MIYEEFKNFESEKDINNPFSSLYIINEEERFYIEPVFYTQLMGFKDLHPTSFPSIVEALIEKVHKYKHVVFTGNYEFIQTEVDDSYIYLEITDITDPLQIYVEDKSRGSDYGD